jgi:branched-chain amino acid transport system substrate-binding protein
MKFGKLSFLWFLICLVTVFTLIGCGNSQTGTKSSDENVVKIGAPNPLTGPFAEGGQNVINGMKLAAEDINNSGGIKALNGAKVEIIAQDTTENPSRAAEVTTKMIETDNVSGLVGAYVSALSLQATTAAEKAKVPIITQSFVDKLTERGYKYTFQLPPHSSIQGEKAIEYVKQIVEDSDADITDVAFVANNDANSINAIESGIKRAREAGFNIVIKETFPTGLTDATPIVSKIEKEKPQIIFMAGALNDEILVIRQLRNQGITTPIVGLGGGGILGKGFPKSLGEFSDNVLSISAWNWDLNQKGIEDVNKRYTKKYDEPFMPQEAGESYIAVWLIKQAIEQAKSAEPKKIREQLEKSVFDTGAAAMMVGGKVDFDEKGYNSAAYPIMIEYKDLLPHTVWPKSDQTMKPILE